MKRLAGRWAVLLLLLTGSGCARDSLESLRKQQVETVNDAVHVLVDIRNNESAVKAKPALKRLGDKWRDLEKRMAALPELSAEDQARAKSSTEQLDGLIVRFLTESLRVAFVPGGKEALNEIGEVKKKR
jgi:hypothetical protein